MKWKGPSGLRGRRSVLERRGAVTRWGREGSSVPGDGESGAVGVDAARVASDY